MRIVQWMLVVSVALFISGIGFVIAGARATRTAVPVSSGPVAEPVASIKQIMDGITGPAATVVYNAVGYIVTAEGVEEIVPQNDEEWAVIANSAAALVESGNLLLLGDRAIDDGDWLTVTRRLIETGTTALRAAEAQDVEGILAIGVDINMTCDDCHAIYQRN